MTEKPSAILTLITEQVIEAYRPIVKAVGEALHELAEILDEIRDEIRDELADTQAREKNRAYAHLITPPLNHAHAHVTHTNTKPPAPTRIYRRRTP